MDHREVKVRANSINGRGVLTKNRIRKDEGSAGFGGIIP